MRRVDSVDQLGEAVSDALSFDGAVIIEQWIDGVEVTVPVLGSGSGCLRAAAGGDRGEGGLLRYGRLPHAGRGRAVRTCAPASLSNDEADAQAIRAEIERAALGKRAVPIRCATSPALILSGTEPRRASWRWTCRPSLAESSPFSLACRSLRFVAVRRPQRTGQPICAVTACGEAQYAIHGS